MPNDSYYQSDLAWVHHAGYSQHVETVGPGIVRLLRDAGLGSGARVLDVGWAAAGEYSEINLGTWSAHAVDCVWQQALLHSQPYRG
jgi:hypothetical protein